MKIARGKVKDGDSYTCPICDYRVKIPRDAARPKLEELQDWQSEIPTLPFQPEEDEVLEDIINCGQEFREFIRPYTNPITSTPDEITTQRFYLRKIEGADILLAFETNFFRQELHKWAPVAPEPPPILEISLSTRKPRPTKQQKLMAQFGVDNPEDLPQQLRTKQHTFKQQRKSTDSSSTKAPQPLQPAPQFKSEPDTMNGLGSAGSRSASNHNYRASGSGSIPHPDPTYATMFATTMSPRINSGAEFIKNSPTFAWQNRLPNQTTSPGLISSPDFRPTTPNASGSNADPSLFSPTNGSFAAEALREAAGAQMTSPARNHYGHQEHSSSGSNNMDNLFADFTTDGAEEPGRNEAGEALEGLGGVGGTSQDDERLADEFLAQN